MIYLRNNSSHFRLAKYQNIYFFHFPVRLDINLDISYTTSATLLASETRYQYIRCVAPSYRSSGELQLAVGLANGKVGLCNFVPSNENNIEFSKLVIQKRPNQMILFRNLRVFFLQLQSNHVRVCVSHGMKLKRGS